MALYKCLFIYLFYLFHVTSHTGSTWVDKSWQRQTLMNAQAAQTLFVIYICDSIALRFKPFKRMYENGSKITLNSTCSKGFK